MGTHVAPVSPVSEGAVEVIRGYNGACAPRALWKTTGVGTIRNEVWRIIHFYKPGQENTHANHACAKMNQVMDLSGAT